MNNIGENVRLYRNVIVRNTYIGENSILGDDVFVTDSVIENRCTLERRSMIFNSTIQAYSYTGYNTVIKYTNIGRFCSISWNVSIGGADHDYTRISTHPFSILTKFGFVDEEGTFEAFSDKLRIGNDVWIGSNSTILRGVTVGDGAVIVSGQCSASERPNAIRISSVQGIKSSTTA